MYKPTEAQKPYLNHLSVPPCKECKDRCADPNCHDGCEKYKVYCEKLKAEKKIETTTKMNQQFGWNYGTKKKKRGDYK